MMVPTKAKAKRRESTKKKISESDHQVLVLVSAPVPELDLTLLDPVVHPDTLVVRAAVDSVVPEDTALPLSLFPLPVVVHKLALWHPRKMVRMLPSSAILFLLMFQNTVP
jgi:hypothetical protein